MYESWLKYERSHIMLIAKQGSVSTSPFRLVLHSQESLLVLSSFSTKE